MMPPSRPDGAHLGECLLRRLEKVWHGVGLDVESVDHPVDDGKRRPPLADPSAWKGRITVEPGVLAGKPTIRGLRISVEHVLRALAAGVPAAEIVEDHPDLEPADLQACLAYAAELVASERVYAVLIGA